jgi:cytochrome b561
MEAAARYSFLSILLHWVMAILIGVAWLLPQVTDILPHDQEEGIIDLHRSVGVTVLALVCIRLVWRLVSPPPHLPRATPLLMRRAAALGHFALYLLMFAVPVLGILFTWSSGRVVSFWGFFNLPDLMDPNPDMRDFWIDLHAVLANTILVLAGLHALTALFHHYVLKDGLLNRILPWQRRTDRDSRLTA